VIAEGIENEFVSDQVRLLGVSLGQGFGPGGPSRAGDLKLQFNEVRGM